MACVLKMCLDVKKNVLQCQSEPTFRYKIISQNQWDTASEIFSNSVIILSLVTEFLTVEKWMNFCGTPCINVLVYGKNS